MRRLWEAALDLVYPPSCCGCGQATRQPAFCEHCCATIQIPSSPLCTVCGTPFATSTGADHVCGRCVQRPRAFGRARACAVYDAADSVSHPLKSVLQRYKYGRDVTLVRPLAQLLQDRAPLSVGDYDLVVPVPLHLGRLRWRGFNQSQLLVRTLARRAGVRVDALSLQRTRATPPQVHLSDRERQHNVRHAFQVIRPQRVRRRRILLFDDVYTTGATVNECSRALLRAGVTRVDVLVLARAVLR